MRICFVVHGYPPEDRTGVENYTEGLAREFALRGHEVHVFTRRERPTLPDLSCRVERRDGTSVHWLTTNRVPGNAREALDPPGIADEFVHFLDEVRPDVVHFQHVIKLGIGLLAATRERGIPIIYTTHDFYPICHRFTLLRPDLATCEKRNDPEACSRCDRAVDLLNSFDLGGWQLGVFESELEAEERERLAATLSESPAEAGADVEESAALRRDLDAARTQAFQCVDLFISPSRYLADALIAGGFDAGRFEVQANGIDNHDLVELPAPRRKGARKLRLGFFGGLSKHKGVQDLLAAFEGLSDVAELTIWGYTTDAKHMARLTAEAERVGATLGGPYERKELPRFYEQIDAIVVPSIWAENQPLVIREAFAARRPVVTTDYGALPESVTDDVDGLLYRALDVESLRATLRRLATEDQLLERLVAGISAPKGVATQADELELRYVKLVSRRDERRRADRAHLPASLQPAAERFDRLSDLSTEELLQRAIVGVDGLRATLGLPANSGLLSAGLAMGLVARNEREEQRRKLEWLEEEASALREENEWRRGAMEHQASELVHRDEALESAQKELEWSREVLQRALGGQEDMVATFTRLEQNLAELGAETGALTEALEWARSDVAALPRLALAAVDVQERFLAKELEPLLERLGSEDQVHAGPIQALRSSLEALHRLLGELSWRRDEMELIAAKLEKGPLALLLAKSKLGQRVRGWEKHP